MAQLSAEGHKRVESFLFEQVFLQKATAALGEEHVSVGWSFVYGSEQEDVPQYWFKLNDPTKGWNEVDDLVADLLSNSGCDVTSVAYYPEDGLFQAQRYDDGRWLERRALREALREITGSASPRTGVRNYSYINRDAQSIAINAIDSIFSDEELYLLSLSRTLTNCYVYPWFAKQPMDLDLCYVVGDHLRFVEFKRKYPAKSGEFGIDEHPHGVLSDWLEDAGTALLHVVLCDPMWNKDVSPTHMLAAGSTTSPHAAWLGTVLGRGAFAESGFSTSGADSGMLGGNRRQRAIRSDAFRLVGMGMNPSSLGEFLRNPEDVSELPVMDIGELKRARDLAQRAYGEQHT